MNKSLIVTVASALILVTAGQAADQGKGAGGPPQHRRMEMPLVPPRLVDKLNLTDAQKSQLQTLEASFDKERESMMAGKTNQLAQLEQQAKTAREAKNEAQLKEIRKQRMELMKPLWELRKESMGKFEATLTPDQKKILDETRQEFREHHGKGPHGAPPAK